MGKYSFPRTVSIEVQKYIFSICYWDSKILKIKEHKDETECHQMWIVCLDFEQIITEMLLAASTMLRVYMNYLIQPLNEVAQKTGAVFIPSPS